EEADLVHAIARELLTREELFGDDLEELANEHGRGPFGSVFLTHDEVAATTDRALEPAVVRGGAGSQGWPGALGAGGQQGGAQQEGDGQAGGGGPRQLKYEDEDEDDEDEDDRGGSPDGPGPVAPI